MIEPAVPSRRLILFAGGVFAVESGFYAVIPPLIPRLVSEAHLTTTQVGLLVAAYPAGVLLGPMPSIAMVDKFRRPQHYLRRLRALDRRHARPRLGNWRHRPGRGQARAGIRRCGGLVGASGL